MRNNVRLITALFFVALLFLGVGLLALPGSLIEEIARSAMLGRLPAIISIPQDEPILGAYRDLGQYVNLLYSAVKIGGTALLLIAGSGLFGCYILDWFEVEKHVVPIIPQISQSLLFLAISVTCIILLTVRGYEGQWYTLESAVRLTASPPYVHRILFPTAARLVLSVFPTLSVTRAFMLIQFMTLLLLVPALYCLSAQFVEKSIAALASALVIPLIFFTTSYYTFYDYGIILFFTLGLLCLRLRLTALYLGVVAVATLNHENVLLLVLVSGAMHKPFASASRYDLRFVALQLLIHFAIRTVLLLTLPVERVAALGNIWINLHFLSMAATHPRALVDTAMLMLWFSIALIGIRNSPRFLRAATPVLPMLVVITFLVGQINEARQFSAFIPIAIALIACQMQSLSRPRESKLIEEAKDVDVTS
jgi:hypothetical protein